MSSTSFVDRLTSIVFPLRFVDYRLQGVPSLGRCVVVDLQPVSEPAVTPEGRAMVVPGCPSDLHAGVAFQPELVPDGVSPHREPLQAAAFLERVESVHIGGDGCEYRLGPFLRLWPIGFRVAGQVVQHDLDGFPYRRIPGVGRCQGVSCFV